MKRRCSPDDEVFRPHYADWGIAVCQPWSESFETFAADMGPHPGEGWSIDRIDNDRGYEPDNCRWATRTQQNGNRGHRIAQPGNTPTNPPSP